MTPNYKKIFSDLVEHKFSEKKEILEFIESKKTFNSIDILEINNLIFGKTNELKSSSHRSYDRESIDYILKFQKENNYSNIEISKHFKLSRNTIALWKKIHKEVVEY